MFFAEKATDFRAAFFTSVEQRSEVRLIDCRRGEAIGPVPTRVASDVPTRVASDRSFLPVPTRVPSEQFSDRTGLSSPLPVDVASNLEAGTTLVLQNVSDGAMHTVIQDILRLGEVSNSRSLSAVHHVCGLSSCTADAK